MISNCLRLGETPDCLTVVLVPGAPLTGSVVAEDGWPLPPELVFGGVGETAYTSTLSDDDTVATWLLTAEETLELSQSLRGSRHVALRDPGSHHVWASGEVRTERVALLGVPSEVEPGGSVTVDTFNGGIQITYSGGGILDASGQPAGTVPTSQGDDTWAWSPAVGSGDMQSSTYDPTGVGADSFDLTNHYGPLDGGTFN